MSTAPSFNPSPAAADAILTALVTDPHASFAGLAAAFDTTVTALALWAASPDIAQRLHSFDTLFAHRTRLLASGLLPQAITTLSAVLDAFHTPAQPSARPSAHPSDHHASPPPQPCDPRTTALRLRAAEIARRAATTLIRLASFTPGPRRVPPAPRMPAREAAPLESPRPAASRQASPRPHTPGEPPRPHPAPVRTAVTVETTATTAMTAHSAASRDPAVAKRPFDIETSADPHANRKANHNANGEANPDASPDAGPDAGPGADQDPAAERAALREMFLAAGLSPQFQSSA